MPRTCLRRLPGRHDHRRCEGQPRAVRPGGGARRQAADVEDRPILIKSKMKETGAPLAGEMSGHVFFADDYYGFDDALYAGDAADRRGGAAGQDR